MAQKIKKTIILLAVLFLSWMPFAQASVIAKTGGPSGGGASTDCNTANPTPAMVNSCVKGNGIITDLNTVVNVLAALVGVVVTGVIVLGGVQYSMAGDNPSAVSAAKQRIINGLIALAAFLLTYAFLQWLIPGGVFG